MIFKQSKLNELVKIFMDENLDPENFTVPDLNKMKFNGIQFTTGYGTEYSYGYKLNKLYYFHFYYNDQAVIYDPRYFPGIKYDSEMIKGAVTFETLKETFKKWLQELKIEIVADDFYQSVFNKQNKPFLIIDEKKDDYFSKEEISQIENHFEQVKKSLLTLNLSATQVKGIENKIYEFISSAKVDKKGKWVDYVIGGLFSAVISLAINPDTANKLYSLIKDGIEAIFFNNGLLLINP